MARPRTIDFHGHFLPQRLIEAYRKTPYGRATSWLWESPAFSDPEEHIKIMDAVGVDVEVIGPSTAFVGAIEAAGMETNEGVRFTNDEYARVIREYPGRFAGSASINPFDIKFSVDEIERSITKLGLKAISMETCYDGLYIDDERFWPVFKIAEELDVPIYAHAAVTTPYWKEAQRSDKDYLRAEIAMFLSSTIAVGRFVMFGIYDRFPKLNVVMGLLAGFIPFMFGRFEVVQSFYQKWPPEAVAGETVFPLRLMADYKGRILGDTHSVDHRALECAVDTLGADCIVLGGDYPITPDRFGIRWNLKQIERMRVLESYKRSILGENAARLLKLDL